MNSNYIDMFSAETVNAKIIIIYFFRFSILIIVGLVDNWFVEGGEDLHSQFSFLESYADHLFNISPSSQLHTITTLID